MNRWLVIALAAISFPVMAQEAAPVTAPVAPVAPATTASPASDAPAAADSLAVAATPALPAAENIPVTLQQNTGNFPPLPPSRPCARPDVDGFWKLKYVFESVRGPTSVDFANNPHQYILFLRDDTYRTHKDVWGEKTDEQVRTQLETTPPVNLQQFLVHESGMVFFYLDGNTVDSQACFIVANARGDYQPGQMIFMPPEGRIATRLAMVYERIYRPSEVRASDGVQPNAGRPRRYNR